MAGDSHGQYEYQECAPMGCIPGTLPSVKQIGKQPDILGRIEEKMNLLISKQPEITYPNVLLSEACLGWSETSPAHGLRRNACPLEFNLFEYEGYENMQLDRCT